MGTDIHLLLQVQDANTNKWYQPEWDKIHGHPYTKSLIDDCLRDRNYSLFYYLSDVRYTHDEPKQEPLWPNRGIPEDLPQPDWKNYYDPYLEMNKAGIDIGDHSFTWFDAQDWRTALNQGKLEVIKEVSPEFFYFINCLFGESWRNEFEGRWRGIQNMRILVGFDS